MHRRIEFISLRLQAFQAIEFSSWLPKHSALSPECNSVLAQKTAHPLGAVVNTYKKYRIFWESGGVLSGSVHKFLLA